MYPVLRSQVTKQFHPYSEFISRVGGIFNFKSCTTEVSSRCATSAPSNIHNIAKYMLIRHVFPACLIIGTQAIVTTLSMNRIGQSLDRMTADLKEFNASLQASSEELKSTVNHRKNTVIGLEHDVKRCNICINAIPGEGYDLQSSHIVHYEMPARPSYLEKPSRSHNIMDLSSRVRWNWTAWVGFHQADIWFTMYVRHNIRLKTPSRMEERSAPRPRCTMAMNTFWSISTWACTTCNAPLMVHWLRYAYAGRLRGWIQVTEEVEGRGLGQIRNDLKASTS